MQNCPASLVTAWMLSCVRLFATPRTVACQAPLSMGFSKRDYWSGLPFPPPGDLPHPGIKLASPVSAGGFFTTEPTGKPLIRYSVQFSRSVVSDSLQPHELQDVRPPCPSPTPGACSNSCPSSQWCHLTISSSVVPFSSWFQSFPASESLPMSQFFASGG